MTTKTRYVSLSFFPAAHGNAINAIAGGKCQRTWTSTAKKKENMPF